MDNIKIHTLANGATVVSTSPGHGFKFSDETVAEPQDADMCKKLTIKTTYNEVKQIKGMKVVLTSMRLSYEQCQFLDELAKMADIIIVPFPVLTAIKEQGMRDRYPNVVAINRTEETKRLPVDQGIVDINNWSY